MTAARSAGRDGLSRFYSGKLVLVTGHTGFKGSWLCTWLDLLGARVVGYSLEPPTDPSMFAALRLNEVVEDVRADIRDAAALRNCIDKFRPDFVFHLAAQPLVRRSYQDPVGTLSTNVMGTVSLLEALRTIEKHVDVVNVTTDKCYSNHEWVYGYRENDPLGGNDPYSASKACSEILTHAYRTAFFSGEKSNVSLASARAGNVIGGGDWGADRLVPDCVRSVVRGDPIVLRNPGATRPWQHVLEPLSGYLWLAAQLSKHPGSFREGWNFGPGESSVRTVKDVTEQFVRAWGSGSCEVTTAAQPHESGLLKLDISKAIHELGWRPVLQFEESMRLTCSWYRQFYTGRREQLVELTRTQIADYEEMAREQSLPWAGP